MSIIEPIWGNIKFNKLITISDLRGLAKVNGEWMLIAIANNIRKADSEKRKTKTGYLK